jgi:hypothetical protein
MSMENLDQGYGAAGDRPRRGWLARNWIWFVPTMLLGLVVLCGGCCVGIFGAVFGVLKSSEPYQMAFQRVQNDPQVTGQLGEPIEQSGWFPSGQISVRNDRGDARFDFDVAGPKGKAHVHAEARRTASRWGLTRLEVTPESGQRIVLDVSADRGDQGGQEYAPLFRP